MFVVAEAGINHNGDLSTALEMVRVASRCGADAIKFQAFTADEFCDPRAAYSWRWAGGAVTETQAEMFRRY